MAHEIRVKLDAELQAKPEEARVPAGAVVIWTNESDRALLVRFKPSVCPFEHNHDDVRCAHTIHGRPHRTAQPHELRSNPFKSKFHDQIQYEVVFEDEPDVTRGSPKI